METAVRISTSTRSKKSSLDSIYTRLKKDFPEVLENELRRIDALLALGKIRGTIKPNEITMSEIVNEVNAVREERYARRKSNF